MVDVENLQDALSAFIVIILVSFVVALAWVSTYVREQPLIATAVVVLQQQVPARITTQDNISTSTPITVQTSPPNESSLSTSNPENSSIDIQNMSLNNRNPSFNDVSNDSGSELQVTQILENDGNGEENIELRNSTSKKVVSGCSTNDSENSNNCMSDIISKDDNLSGSSKAESNFYEDKRTCINDTNHVCKDSISCKSVEKHNNVENETENCDPISIQQDKSCEITDKTQVYVEKQESVVRQRKTLASSSDEVVSKESISLSEDDSKTSTVDDNENEDNSESRPPGSIRIRLKFLDDTQRLVHGLIDQQVISFKR